MNQFNKKNFLYIFLAGAGCIVLYWLLHEADRVQQVAGKIASIFSPFVLGSAIAFILNVPMRAIEGKLGKIQKESLRRLIAVVLTIIIVLLVIAGMFWLLIPQLISAVESLIPQIYEFLLDSGKHIMDRLDDNPELFQWLLDNTNLENFNWAQLAERIVSFLGNSATSILQKAVSAIGNIADVTFNVVVGIVFAVYCLFQKETLARQARRLAYAFMKEKRADAFVRVLRLSNSTFSNFLSGQCIEVCILGAMFAVGMAIFRMPYIALVSVLIAITAFIPIVGAWVGCIVGTFLILVVNPVQAFWFLVMFIVIQQIEGNLIYPKVVGTSIGLNGMWVLVAITVGGELMGIAGMFVMIPFASVIYALLREHTNKRLGKLEIDPEKLKAQPPELKSNFKEIRETKREKRLIRRADRKSCKKKK